MRSLPSLTAKTSLAKMLPVLLLLLLSSAVIAQTTSGTTAAGLTYSATNAEITITGYKGSSGGVTIPATINVSGASLPVTMLGNSVFRDKTTVTSVTIPASVKSIGSEVFFRCYGLTAITVDAANTTFSSTADGALFDKDQLTLFQVPGGKTGNYTLPASVTNIGYQAFASCVGVTSITANASSIGFSSSMDGVLFDKRQAMLFRYPPGKLATSYSIPSGVTSFDYYAFYSCAALTTITIPSSLTTIRYPEFTRCFGLSSITVDPSNTAFSSSADGVLFNKNQSTIFTYPAGKTGSGYSIPDGVTTISQYAFAYNTSLESVTMPNTLTTIQGSAFSTCTNLRALRIPGSVTSIGSQAFAGCSNLKIAVFRGNAPTAGQGVFGNLGASNGFSVYYYNGATGFTSPTWKDSSGDTYPSVNMGASTPLPPWLVANGFAYNANLQSTPNNDGVPLLMAYALNLDPTQNQRSSIPKPVISRNQMSLTYYAGSPGVSYSVETSIDLQTWNSNGVTTSAPDASSFCMATIPITNHWCFMRLRVTY